MWHFGLGKSIVILGELITHTTQTRIEPRCVHCAELMKLDGNMHMNKPSHGSGKPGNCRF